MAQIQQRLLNHASAMLAVTVLLSAAQTAGPRFRADDPLWREPAPRSVPGVANRDIDEIYDFFENTFVEPRRELRVARREPQPARNVNSLGEVPDSSWYTNRHAQREMSMEELVRGPGDSEPPLPRSTWRIIAAKKDGVSPGFMIEDSRGRRYLIKFDPPRYPELASAADVIGSKFFYALGYNTPENYIVRFGREQLVVSSGATWRDAEGRRHPLTNRMIDRMLAEQPRDRERRYRAMASRFIAGKIVGPYRYEGARTDDPNDIVPHEDRRDLRGLAVFCAWLNHTDAKSINTLDTVVEENGRRFLKHYLIDFGATLGSDSLAPKDPRLGHEYFIDLKATGWQVLTLGLYPPRWTRAHFPSLTGVDHFEAEVFDPLHWKSNYPNPAFLLLDHEDAFWAAKKLLAFTDEQIRAIVKTGEYSDPRAAEWIAECLIQRRDKIERAYLTGAVPLDRFRVENGRLAFTDLSGSVSTYSVNWAVFDNGRSQQHAIPGVSAFSIAEALRAAPDAQYLAATIRREGRENPRVTVYLRTSAGGAEVVGLDRSW